MSGLDDLRRALAERADDAALGSAPALDRRSAVGERIVVARRRRRIAAAGAAAAVLAVVVGLVSIGGPVRPDALPVDPAQEVFGVEVPETFESFGFTYHLAEVVRGDGGEVSLELPESDEVRLVSWATSTDAQRVELSVLPYQASSSVERPDFADFVQVLATPSLVEARVPDGEVALAVYEVGDERPPGVTVDGVTFRESRAGGRLLDAAIGEPGEAELTLEFEDPGAPVAYTYFCSGGGGGDDGGDGGTGLQIDFVPEDEDIYSTGNGCTDPLPADAATPLFGADVQQSRDGPRTVVLRAVSGLDDAPADDPDLRVGIAAYELPTVPAGDTGLRADSFVETGGHLYELVDVVPVELGDGTQVPVPADLGPALVGFVFGPRVDARILVDGESKGDLTLAEVWLPGDHVVELEPRGARADGATSAVTVYRRVD